MRIVSKEIELNFAPMPENTAVLAFLRRKKFIPKSDLVLRRNSALETLDYFSQIPAFFLEK